MPLVRRLSAYVFWTEHVPLPYLQRPFLSPSPSLPFYAVLIDSARSTHSELIERLYIFCSPSLEEAIDHRWFRPRQACSIGCRDSHKVAPNSPFLAFKMAHKNL